MYSATSVQRQFWLLYQQDKTSSAYNIPSTFKIVGKLKLTELFDSIEEVFNKFEILRSVFKYHNAELVYHPLKNIPCQGSTEDFSGKTEYEILSHLKLLARKPFDLETGPLFRWHIIKYSQDVHYLMIVIHHIVFDLRSKDLFSIEVEKNYNKYCGVSNERNITFAQNNYSEYSSWQKKWLESSDFKRQLSFWNKKLSGQKSNFSLPLDNSRPSEPTFIGNSIPIEIDNFLTDKLRLFCKTHSTQPFLVLLAAYAIILQRYNDISSIVFSVSFTNRRNAGFKDTMGCFVNNLPLLVELSDDPSFSEVLSRVREEMLLVHRNQETPFEEIIKNLNPIREAGKNPVFSTGFTFESPMRLNLHGLSCQPIDIHNGGAQLDIFFRLWDAKSSIKGKIEYNSSIYHKNKIQRFVKNFYVLLEEVLENFTLPISNFSVLSEEERKITMEVFNKTDIKIDKSRSIIKTFEEQVKLTPHALAILFDQVTLDYTNLNKLINKLSRKIKKQQNVQGRIIGICMERSIEMVISIYAVLKSGAAYIPLDPSLPSDRLEFMIQDSGLSMIMVQKDLEYFFPNHRPKLLTVSYELLQNENLDVSNPTYFIEPDSLAYIIYTSGSTGLPKGVMIEHNSIYNRLFWMQDTFKLKSNDTILQKTPFSFDVSVWEFFWPLMYGAKLAISKPGNHKDPKKIEEDIKNYKVTKVHFVPSMLDIFLNYAEIKNCVSLTDVFCSGEALSGAQKTKFYSKTTINLHNLYGPTEATVDVTWYKCNKDDIFSTIPIGSPVYNTQVYVLNQALKPLPIGVVGELCIAGRQVARGYLNREQLNKEKFIKNPFDSTGDSRLYKTGDMVRWHPDGFLEFIGRNDDQIKIRGNRVELMEICSILELDSSVAKAVVIAVNNEFETQLIAYIQPIKGEKLNIYRLKQTVNSKLPEYMRPAQYFSIPNMPLSSSGKVDRKSLPGLGCKIEGPIVNIQTASSNTQKKLIVIWEKYLKQKNISIDDTYFELGGSSFSANRLMDEISQKFNKNLPVTVLFQHSTIRALASYIDAKQDFEIKIDENSSQKRKKIRERRRQRKV